MGAMDDLPANWSVDGPEVTAKGTAYYVLTGTFTAEMGRDREVALLVFRPKDGAWQMRGDIGNEARRSGLGTREEVLRAAVNEAEAINDEWADIDGFEVW